MLQNQIKTLVLKIIKLKQYSDKKTSATLAGFVNKLAKLKKTAQNPKANLNKISELVGVIETNFEKVLNTLSKQIAAKEKAVKGPIQASTATEQTTTITTTTTQATTSSATSMGEVLKYVKKNLELALNLQTQANSTGDTNNVVLLTGYIIKLAKIKKSAESPNANIEKLAESVLLVRDELEKIQSDMNRVQIQKDFNVQVILLVFKKIWHISEGGYAEKN
jgi:hypothetical protein